MDPIKEAFFILNAWLLPDKNETKLYKNITSVNTFRVLFDTYFGTNFGLAKDDAFILLEYSRRLFRFGKINHILDAEKPEKFVDVEKLFH